MAQSDPIEQPDRGLRWTQSDPFKQSDRSLQETNVIRVSSGGTADSKMQNGMHW